MLGVGDASLLEEKDEEKLVAVEAIVHEAEAYQVKVHESLATEIINRLGEAFGGSS